MTAELKSPRRRQRSGGIRRHRDRWQAFIRINGQFVSRTFPLETPRPAMQAWRQLMVRQAPVVPHATPPPSVVPLTTEQQQRVRASVETILTDVQNWQLYSDDELVARFCADVRARLERLV